MKINFYKQLDENDCGPACLKMVLDAYGKRLPIQQIRTACQTTQEGTSLQQLMDASEQLGTTAFVVKLPCGGRSENPDDINDIHDVPLPAILHWNKHHYVVLEWMKPSGISIVDPGLGRLKISIEDFRHFWIDESINKGYALIFDNEESESIHRSETMHRTAHTGVLITFLKKYLLHQKVLFAKVALLIMSSVLLGFVTPYFTSNIIDVGLLSGNKWRLWLILAGQVLVYLGSAFTHYIEAKMAARLSQQLNATLVFDYLKKILRLPLKTFDGYKTSDFLMRTYDFSKIDSFVSYNLINLSIAVLLLVAFMVVLFFYSATILLVFVLFQLLNVLVGWYFMKQRRKYMLLRFKYQTDSFSSMIEIVEGLRDIRLSGSEAYRLGKWEKNMKAYYRNNLSDIDISRKQGFVTGVIGNLFNLAITVITASMLLQGHITLGAMVAIQFVIGQLNASASNITGSFSILQDLKISFERINSINDLEEEPQRPNLLPVSEKTPALRIENLAFSYAGSVAGSMQLNNINCSIEPGSVTAIVGSSGSGKTTLLKLLLGFYEPLEGKILLDNIDLKGISLSYWRSKCGVVMQDGYVFNDSILNNVIQEEYQEEKFDRYVSAVKAAGIYDFITTLPQQHNTVIGNSGVSLSSGQKQRIFIARMMYRKPSVLILDEATNQLDAITEHLVLNNLNSHFAGTTRIVVAHRIYAVQNADKIIVLDKGVIVEQGRHEELLENKGHYYQLYSQQKGAD